MIFSAKRLPALADKTSFERWRLLSEAAATEPTYIASLLIVGLLSFAIGYFFRGVIPIGDPNLGFIIPVWIAAFVLATMHHVIMLNTVFMRRFGDARTDVPLDTQIQRLSDADSVTLRWKIGPDNRLARLIIAGFAFLWLLVVLHVVVFGLTEVFGFPRISDWPRHPGFYALFAVWLAIGLLMIYAGVRMLRWLLRVPRPAALTLWPDRMRYDTGSTAAFTMAWSRGPRSTIRAQAQPEIFELTRDQCPAFSLAPAERGSQLFLEQAAGRVSIGDSLSQSDKEWLFAVLQRWQRGEDAFRGTHQGTDARQRRS